MEDFNLISADFYQILALPLLSENGASYPSFSVSPLNPPNTWEVFPSFTEERWATVELLELSNKVSLGVNDEQNTAPAPARENWREMKNNFIEMLAGSPAPAGKQTEVNEIYQASPGSVFSHPSLSPTQSFSGRMSVTSINLINLLFSPPIISW